MFFRKKDDGMEMRLVTVRSGSWATLSREMARKIYGMSKRGYELATHYDPISRSRSYSIEFSEED